MIALFLNYIGERNSKEFKNYRIKELRNYRIMELKKQRTKELKN